MDTPSPIDNLAYAFGSTIRDLRTPKILRDKLFQVAAELRDALTPDQARTVDAAEAEAVISSFASSDPDLTQSPTRPDVKIPLGDALGTSEARARLLSSL